MGGSRLQRSSGSVGMDGLGKTFWPKLCTVLLALPRAWQLCATLGISWVWQLYATLLVLSGDTADLCCTAGL